jgi:hypothetical protein
MKQTQQIPNPHLDWIILNNVKINSMVWWKHYMDMKCSMSSINFPLHNFTQNWNLYLRPLLINTAHSLLYISLKNFEIWNRWEIILAAFTHDTYHSYYSDTGSSLFNNTTITALYFAAPLSALQFLHPVCQYFPAQTEEAVYKQELPGSKITVYRQSQTFVHNSFLNMCRKVKR